MLPLPAATVAAAASFLCFGCLGSGSWQMHRQTTGQHHYMSASTVETATAKHGTRNMQGMPYGGHD
jgi:hypothetical protein